MGQMKYTPFQPFVNSNSHPGLLSLPPAGPTDTIRDGGCMADIGGYQTIRELASGSDAGISLVRRASDGRSFAMKRALPTEHAAKAIRMEYRILDDLEHPNLLKVHELIEDGSRPALILDYFPGATLRSAMHAGRRDILRRLGYIAEQCGAALTYLHERRIYHGDVKPENILVTPNGRVRVIDFSIASASLWQRVFPGKLAGTPKYMAPELIRTKRPTPAADLYALGVICYEIIAGRPPFDGASSEDILSRHLSRTVPSLRSHLAGISSSVNAAVLGALSKSPEDRPRSCQAFGRRLARALGSPLEVAERLGYA